MKPLKTAVQNNWALLNRLAYAQRRAAPGRLFSPIKCYASGAEIVSQKRGIGGTGSTE